MDVHEMIEKVSDPLGMDPMHGPKVAKALAAALRMALMWNEYHEWQCGQAKTSEELEDLILGTKQMRKAFEAFQDATSVEP